MCVNTTAAVSICVKMACVFCFMCYIACESTQGMTSVLIAFTNRKHLNKKSATALKQETQQTQTTIVPKTQLVFK